MGSRILSDMTMGTGSSWRWNTVHVFVEGPAVSVQILCTGPHKFVELCTYLSLVVCCTTREPVESRRPVFGVSGQVLDLAELKSWRVNFWWRMRLSVWATSEYDREETKICSFGKKWLGMVARWDVRSPDGSSGLGKK